MKAIGVSTKMGPSNDSPTHSPGSLALKTLASFKNAPSGLQATEQGGALASHHKERLSEWSPASYL